MALPGSSNFAGEPQLGDLEALDPASQVLVAELALNDIAAIQATRKGKARSDVPLSDEELAFDVQATSLNALIETLRDHRLASSIDLAIESDTDQLQRLVLQELAEHDDHRAAVALRDGHDMPQQTASQRMVEQIPVARRQPQDAREPLPTYEEDAESTTDSEDLEYISMDMENVRITGAAAAPKAAPRPSSNRTDRWTECVICGDPVAPDRSFKAPCADGHRYCRGCIVSLVEASLRDESLYPLRCCQEPLPLDPTLFHFIPRALRFQFLDKAREYATPAKSRVYCSNPRCSAFLGASDEEDTETELVCIDCFTKTCSQCKNNAHPGFCFENQLTLQLRETATANKWQTCPACHAIVELSHGCYHITCRCSMQFCYLCAAPWKTCRCEQWDDDLLLNDADRRVRNQFGDRVAEMQPAIHATRVSQRMEALRESHECQSHFWRYRHGCGECEECGDYLPIFLMRCMRCQTLACRRCSINRL